MGIAGVSKLLALFFFVAQKKKAAFGGDTFSYTPCYHSQSGGRGTPCSALLLLVLRVLADDHHMALALDDLALFANGFDRGTNLHAVFLHSYGRRKRPIGVAR